MKTADLTLSQLQRCVAKLHAYLRAADYSGYDPYDGLQSRVYRALPFHQSKWVRTAMTQAMKRSPWNLRGLLGVPRERNPKGIALCVSALAQLARTNGASTSRDLREPVTRANGEEAHRLLDWLREHRAPGYSTYCWGYNFDWQSRSFWAPRGTPNVACCIAVAEALLDAYKQFGRTDDLETARSACTFLREHLLVRTGRETYFRYIPGNDIAFHNVSLLAAALLARVAALTGEPELRELAADVAGFSVRRQKEDGSWNYGESHNQRWTDNFHTGFTLVALSRYARYTGDERYRRSIERGRDFWERNFFAPDGTPKYYPNARYPLDVHSAAQAILTHLEFCTEDAEALEKARRAAAWALRNLWSEDGYFYFQIRRTYTIRIPYVRWSQAWMFYACSSLLASCLAARPGMGTGAPVSVTKPLS